MKGLGAVLAAYEMSSRPHDDETPLCPFCGQPMEFASVAWFCFGVDENLPQSYVESAQAEGYNPFAYYPSDGAVEAVAAVVVNGEPVLWLEPARDRGHFGGWKIDDCREKSERTGVAALIAKYHWTWYDWVQGYKQEEGYD